MSIRPDTAPPTTAPVMDAPEICGTSLEDAWELDVSIVESGPAADQLIRMTNDGCGQTCESACSTTCP